MPKHQLITGAAITVMFTFPLTGCGPTIDANTTCREFMQQSASVRDDAVTRIGAERGNSMVVTPLGRPNVEFLCAQAPDWTLGQVIDKSR